MASSLNGISLLHFLSFHYIECATLDVVTLRRSRNPEKFIVALDYVPDVLVSGPEKVRSGSGSIGLKGMGGSVI